MKGADRDLNLGSVPYEINKGDPVALIVSGALEF